MCNYMLRRCTFVCELMNAVFVSSKWVLNSTKRQEEFLTPRALPPGSDPLLYDPLALGSFWFSGPTPRVEPRDGSVKAVAHGPII